MSLDHRLEVVFDGAVEIRSHRARFAGSWRPYADLIRNGVVGRRLLGDVFGLALQILRINDRPSAS